MKQIATCFTLLSLALFTACGPKDEGGPGPQPDAGNDAQGDANPPGDTGGDTAKPECTKNEECSGTKPVCELTTKTCRAATRNADCVDSAVDADGSCHNMGKVVYVDSSRATGTNCPGSANGSSTEPYCFITQALDKIDGTTKDLILLRKGNGYTTNPIKTFELKKSVRIAGTGEWVNGKPPVVMGDAFLIQPGAAAITVTLDELNLVGSPLVAAPKNLIECGRTGTNPAITLQAWSLWIEKAQQVGLLSDGCAVSVHRSVFTKNEGRGLSIKNTTEKGGVFNSMIIGNGSDNTNAGGIELAGLSTDFFLLFNTFADNKGKVMVAAANDGYGLKCSGTAKPVLHASLMIPTAGNTNKTVDGCTVTYSAIDAASSGGATTNVTDVDPAKLTFKNAAQADYHITGGEHVSKLRKKWTDVQGALPASFKAVDYDGDARDKGQDTYIGADHVAP